MWACAHEQALAERKTVRMTSRHSGPDASGSDHTEDSRDIRYSVVSDWYDADRMGAADVSGELAGQRVVALPDSPGEVIAYSPGLPIARSAGTPGFLFTGDDGDSLWFWPESEEIAFRFEPESGRRLRRSLSEAVNRLVSQGALVFCTRVEANGASEAEFEFPILEERAA